MALRSTPAGQVCVAAAIEQVEWDGHQSRACAALQLNTSRASMCGPSSSAPITSLPGEEPHTITPSSIAKPPQLMLHSPRVAQQQILASRTSRPSPYLTSERPASSQALKCQCWKCRLRGHVMHIFFDFATTFRGKRAVVIGAGPGGTTGRREGALPCSHAVRCGLSLLAMVVNEWFFPVCSGNGVGEARLLRGGV